MFHSSVDPSLLPLAWVAIVELESLQVNVRHGSLVEAGDGFVVEGVWSGDFRAGAFHHAEHFFGSGIRTDAEGVWIAPSCALVDRVFCYIKDGRLVTANSLPLVLSESGAALDQAVDYRKEAFTILNGIEKYDPEFRIGEEDGGRLLQHYFYPLLVTSEGIEQRSRPWGTASLADYSSYLAALDHELAGMAENARHPLRKNQMSLFSTVSAGYDSAATTALVARFGLEAAYTSRRSNSTIVPWLSKEASVDDGTVIARTLGVEVRYLEQKSSGIDDSDEMLFLSASPADTEIIFHTLARDLAETGRPSVLFTGYHGDKLWEAVESPEYTTPEIRRGDTSGLNLGEIRLRAGFINVPVPFLYARRVDEIRKISQSDQLRPWSVGGDYDRPIPRRILETAGVKRTVFGTRKRAVVQTYPLPQNRDLRERFLSHIRATHGVGRVGVELRRKARVLRVLSSRLVEVVAGRLGIKVSFDYSDHTTLGVDFPTELFRWAVANQVRQQASLNRRGGVPHS